MKAFVSTHPFGEVSKEPLKLAESNGIKLILNPYGRKITSDELAKEIRDSEVLVAGTEKITAKVFENAPKLKLISRVGIGLDGIDFDLCKKYGVKVAYTPDAPTMAVAELCVGLIIDLARKITNTNNNLKFNNIWHRHMGWLLYGKTIGILGMGRIGKSLIHLMSPFNVKFKAYDIKPDIAFARLYNVDLVPKEDVLKNSDVVSVNVPLKNDTYDYIAIKELKMMKTNAILINTSRGEVVNEDDLYYALKEGIIAGGGIDVFKDEPYSGKLKELENCILTCHMGASTIETREQMELQAIEEVVRFKKGMPLKNEVVSNG